MAFTTSGLMEGATSPAAAKFMGAVSAPQSLDSWSLAQLEQQRALQRYIQESLSGASTDSSASSIINLPPAQKPYPFKPISTILDPWNRYRPVKPVGPIDDTPKKEPDPIEGGDGIHTRDVPYAWEDWANVNHGVGMKNPKTGFMDGFKSAIGNAKIGLTGNLGLFNSPLDDPGWQSVMEANNMDMDTMKGYFSMPGQPMAANYQEAMKQHSYMGMPQMEKFDTQVKDIAKGYTSFANGTHSFDRTGFMSALANVNPDYAKSIVSVNNARMTETMYGAMALNNPGVKGTAFSSITAFQAMPSYAYDTLNALTSAGLKLDDLKASSQFSKKMNSMKPIELFQYVTALKDSPQLAAREVERISSMKTAVEQISKGGVSNLDPALSEFKGAAVSEVAKGKLGLDPTKDFTSAIESGLKTTQDVIDALHSTVTDKEPPSEKTEPSPESEKGGDGGEGGSDGGVGGNDGGVSGLDADGNPNNNESGMVGEESW